MKKLLLILFISIFSFTLCGCEKENYLDGAIAVVYQNDIPYLINTKFETYSLEKYDYIVPEFGKYLVVSNTKGDDKVYGFIKNTGEEIIKPTYTSATVFSEDKAIVGLDGKLMIINPQNDCLYTFPQNMHSSKLYSEDMLVVEVDGKYTYLDNNFNLADIAYDYAASFVNGYAVVGNIIDGQIQYGLIDKQFNVVIPLEHDFLDSYYDGYCRVADAVDAKNNEYIYHFIKLDGTYLLNENGKIASYDYALNFSNGVAVVADYTTQDLYGTYKVYKFIGTDGKDAFSYRFKHEGEGLYYFENLVYSSMTDTLVSVYRFKTSGAGAWSVLELYDGTFEAITLTIPEEFKDNENIIYFKSPYEMTNFKYTNNEMTEGATPYARVRIYTGQYGLIDATGTYVLPADYSFLFY
ncbi:MAG: WG repeat-containing protein [Bacilli bacterium]|nr:WG repeat-containing protein [Bacilli bacterium]